MKEPKNSDPHEQELDGRAQHYDTSRKGLQLFLCLKGHRTLYYKL